MNNLTILRNRLKRIIVNSFVISIKKSGFFNSISFAAFSPFKRKSLTTCKACCKCYISNVVICLLYNFNVLNV
jgi:hypothetical protein